MVESMQPHVKFNSTEAPSLVLYVVLHLIIIYFFIDYTLMYSVFPFNLSRTSDCVVRKYYVRDFRSDRYETTLLENPYAFSLSSNDSWLTNGTYPINQDKVWQISVPKGYTVNISLSSLFGDQKKGRCGDYISLYADDDAPEVMCSEKLTNRSINKSGIEKLTIKFHSDSVDASGFFDGTVFLYPESESTTI